MLILGTKTAWSLGLTKLDLYREVLPESAVGVESLSLPALPLPLTNTLSLDLKEPFPCDSHIRRARSVQGGEERAWGLEQARDVLVSVL